MYSSIIKGVMSISLVAVMFSCNQGESLQSYYVNNQEVPNFISVDVPVSFVEFDEDALTLEQKEAYKSIDKLNMLGYNFKEGNEEEYKAELAKVQTILNNEKYEELIRGGNAKNGKFVVKMIAGEGESIDELIVFGSSNDRGFAIVRVLGDDMEPSKIMKLGDALDKMNTEENAIKDFMNFFQ